MFNEPNGVSFTLLYGCYHYEPTVAEKEDCSSNMRFLSKASHGYQRDVVEIPVNGGVGNVYFNLADFNALQSEHLEDKHITESQIFKHTCTLNKRYGFLPFIYERDEKEWSEQEIESITWFPRIMMFSTAFKCGDIFAISIVPKNPSIQQTWYLKKAKIHDPLYDFCRWSEGTKKDYACTDGSDQRDPQPEDWQGGFIKPFENYYSNDHRSTIDLGRLPPTAKCEHLSNQQDVERVVSLHDPQTSQEAIKSILNQFLLDSEATHLGLLTLNPHQQWIFLKGKIAHS